MRAASLTTLPAADSPSPRQLRQARLLVLAAALLWSTGGIFVKAPVFDSWTDAERGAMLAFWRALFAGTLLIPFVRAPRFRVGFVPMVISFAIMNVAYLSAMSLTTAANAIWLQSTGPLWVVVLTALLYRQRIARADLIALVFGMTGVATILALESAGQNFSGITLGLISGAAYAGVVLTMQSVSRENSAWIVVLNQLFAALVLFPWVLLQGSLPDLNQLLVLAAFGFIQIGLPYILFARGLKTIASTEASLIALLEPVLLPVWVFLLWNERAAWWTVLGGVFILLGLAFRYSAPGIQVAAARLRANRQS